MVSAIVEKFVSLQRENPMLALEALFKFQSADIKQQVLSNYSYNSYGFVDKDMDENIVFQDEELNYEPQSLVEGSDQKLPPDQFVDENAWTQEMDEVLINNWHSVQDLSKTKRFMILSEMVSAIKQKDLSECHERAKLLKLKKVNLVEARQNSAKLLKKQRSQEEDTRIG